jgi:predicted O-linked N-acetylglucosamine transferase (SPINDLY family)
MRRRVAAACDRFLDVRDERDAEVAAMLRALQIDIAVDLKGHTQGNRAGILAHRPAPVQITYLGMPATMGADYIDYLIAEPRVIPPAEFPHYAERILYLPDSYQATDDTRAIAAHTPSRAELALPEDGFVFCCFNNSYKITPAIFDIWTRLLAKVDGSVLWLFEAHPEVRSNLSREAQRRGIDAARLVFAPRLRSADHLARQKRADLFLDTLPYNAHTTASEALWVGLPVLTCLGSSFAGRFAASLLHAVGLPELVATSLADYEATALRLATQRDELAALKERLAANRAGAALFDAPRFACHIEGAYRRMWAIHAAGEKPQAFGVPPMPR